MRVGVVAPEFPPDIGGVETYGYEFAVELARRGHQVSVFTCPHASGESSGRGFEVLPLLKVERSSDEELLRMYPMDAWHVMNAAYAWMALETQPVVVSVHGNDFINPYLLARVACLSRLPYFWRFESQLRPVRALLRRRTARREMWCGLASASQVVANSEYTKSILLQYIPSCASNTSVGYVGVGDDFLRVRRPRSVEARFKTLTTVCRLNEPRKNVDKTLRALAQLKQYEFKYTVVGDGILRPALESLSRTLGLSDRVLFTGFISKLQIQQIFATSDLFILTSDLLPNSVEGFGIAYLEANACGVPVLAARNGGASEALCEGKSGYFVDEPTVPAITAGLERYLKNEVHFNRADCQAFAKKFTWGRVVDHAMQFYVPKRPATLFVS